MSKRMLLAFNILICFMIVENLAGRLDFDDDFDDDEIYHPFKRFLFRKPTSDRSQKNSNILENLIKPTKPHYAHEGPSSLIDKITETAVSVSSGPCGNNPCGHGGVCIPKGTIEFECKCVGPWRGLFCGIADACQKSPCQNGGICLNLHDDYWCKCPTGYHGMDCEQKFGTPDASNNVCQSNICNTGKCVSLEMTYYCECPADRYGEHCEKRFSKRLVSNPNAYYDLWHKLKRAMTKSDKNSMKKLDDDDDVAVYDVRNGIYFRK